MTGIESEEAASAAAPADDRLPKAYRLKMELLELVRGLAPGSPIASERALAERYGVARTTVRQALQELMFDGRLYRLQGRGTFVARPKLTQALQLTSHTREMQTSGLAPGSRLLAIGALEATGELAERLGLEDEAQVWKIERLRLANEEPMAVESLFVARDRFPRLDERLGTSFYGTLRDEYGVRLAGGEETIECVLATPLAASVLAVEPRSPMLKLTRRSWDADDRIVEYVESLYRGDRYRFVTALQPPEETP